MCGFSCIEALWVEQCCGLLSILYFPIIVIVLDDRTDNKQVFQPNLNI